MFADCMFDVCMRIYVVRTSMSQSGPRPGRLLLLNIHGHVYNSGVLFLKQSRTYSTQR